MSRKLAVLRLATSAVASASESPSILAANTSAGAVFTLIGVARGRKITKSFILVEHLRSEARHREQIFHLGKIHRQRAGLIIRICSISYWFFLRSRHHVGSCLRQGRIQVCIG